MLNIDFPKVARETNLLKRADLRRTDLREANLRGANLRGTNLREADLRNVDLQGANLWGTNLRDANLRGADLRGADLRGADLREADLDFSCWPLWCGSFDVKVDNRLILQLAAHLSRLNINDASEEVKLAIENLPKILKNGFCEYRNDVKKI